jgi:hypothetical protein
MLERCSFHIERFINAMPVFSNRCLYLLHPWSQGGTFLPEMVRLLMKKGLTVIEREIGIAA